MYMRQKSFSVTKLEKTIILLQRQIALDSVYRDHKLKGSMEGIRECHIYPNILLMYEVLEKESILSLLDIGSHSKLKLA